MTDIKISRSVAHLCATVGDRFYVNGIEFPYVVKVTKARIKSDRPVCRIVSYTDEVSYTYRGQEIEVDDDGITGGKTYNGYSTLAQAVARIDRDRA
jgi:hypothetical protein